MISRWAMSLAGCTVARMCPRDALAWATLRPGIVAVNRYFCLFYACDSAIRRSLSAHSKYSSNSRRLISSTLSSSSGHRHFPQLLAAQQLRLGQLHPYLPLHHP